MDAKTFKKENQIPNRLTMNVGIGEFNNLNGAISYDPDQKWYYLSNQTPRDVLIFHQYSKVPDSRNKSKLIYLFYQGKWLANPHTAFKNRNCPQDTESRISAELRVGLFF